MWVRRAVGFIKPGLMAEAIAHLKKAMNVSAGTRLRVLRPINGPEANHQIVVEFEFEDLEAAMAFYRRPGPAGDWERRWVELSQSRDHWELFRVRHSVPGPGQPGPWVDRRERWLLRRKQAEALDLWRTFPSLQVPGWSMRIMTARTGVESPALWVVEITCDSLTEADAALGKFTSTPEGVAFVTRMGELERGEPNKDVLVVVE